jgi:D-alanyl-D-alanine carboxypeptidase
METNRPIRLSPTALVIVILMFFFGTYLVHLWITDHRAVLRALYPIEARITYFRSACDPQAEEWLEDLIGYVGQYSGGLANQIAYVGPQGELHHCERGWMGAFFRSPPITSDTRFRYASTTKLVTADAVLSLVREGHLQLDNTLAQLFPELQPFADSNVSAITIRMLLMHAGGFDRTIFADPMFALNVKPWCPLNMQELSATRLHFYPGSKYSYSNLGYCILGAIIERVSGQSYREYVRQQYDLERYGIQFLDGPYLEDEVRYDFRHDEFYDVDYSRFFDFYAVSSSAGLSGSASALAQLVKDLLRNSEPNLLSGMPLTGCDPSKIRSCYTHSFYIYQHPASGKKFHMQEGYFPGSSSVVMVDEMGGVLVILSAGAIPGGEGEKEKFYNRVVDYLLDGYQ